MNKDLIHGQNLGLFLYMFIHIEYIAAISYNGALKQSFER